MSAREDKNSSVPAPASGPADQPAQNQPRAASSVDQPTVRMSRPRALVTPKEERRPESPDILASSQDSSGPSAARLVLPSQFSPQEVLAQRFRIVRFIGRGGMGEVYEAEDLELHEHVALKTIRADAGADARAIGRFKREINLARRVTHPNVCRTFDIFRHKLTLPDGAIHEINFLSMELLEGETLAERLRRTGRLTTAEAFPLVIQMASALAAAHKQHIVHRDFKSQNVILARPRAGHLESRAVVTDFGLARVAAEGEPSNSTIGDFAGSPPYMAPEQVEGGEVTASADIYALGVVMYEIVSGVQPFVGETALATAVKRLKGPAPSPRARVPDLAPVWERAILRCLERRPADRFSGAEQVVEALRGVEVPSGARALHRRLAIPFAVAVVLLMAVASGYKLFVAGRSARISPPSAVRITPLSTNLADHPTDVGTSPRHLNSPEIAHQPLASPAATGKAPEGLHRNSTAAAKSLAASAVQLWQRGELEGARKIFEETAAKLNVSGDQVGTAWAMTRIAGILDDQGQLDAAERKHDQALTIFAAADYKPGVAEALDVAVHVMMHRGDLKSGLEKNQEMIRICRQLGDASGLSEAQRDRGLLLEQQDDLPAGRENLRQSLAARNSLGLYPAAAESRADLAELSIHEGRFSEAETSARQAAEEFQKEGARDKQALALNTLARALLAQGKREDAQKMLNEIGPLLKGSQNRYLRVAFSISLARGKAATSLPAGEAEAEQSLSEIIKATKKDGLVGLEFQARLALGEIQVKSGNRRSGRSRLTALERQAAEKGFALIAREAGNARHPSSVT